MMAKNQNHINKGVKSRLILWNVYHPVQNY